MQERNIFVLSVCTCSATERAVPTVTVLLSSRAQRTGHEWEVPTGTSELRRRAKWAAKQLLRAQGVSFSPVPRSRRYDAFRSDKSRLGTC